MIKTPRQVAEELNVLYEMAFAGKNSGRYKISRSKLRLLSGRKRLESSIIKEIVDAAYEQYGLVMVELEDVFAIIRENVMLTYRPVPSTILRQFGEDYEEIPEKEDQAGELSARRLRRRNTEE